MNLYPIFFEVLTEITIKNIFNKPINICYSCGSKKCIDARFTFFFPNDILFL